MTAVSCQLILFVIGTWTCVRQVVADFRHVPYDDIKSTWYRFADPEVTTYSQVLFDTSRNQLIVGARDALFRLNIDTLEKLEKAEYRAPENKTSLCREKGQTEADCHNYNKVLQSNGRKIFTCGTNSFSPLCSWREIENLNNVIEWVSGIAKCPYSPHANITSIMTKNGQYYVGSPINFAGEYAAITRSLGKSDTLLSTNQHDSKWLNQPQFVGSFETEQFVYFLFREPAVEYINCGKIMYSRIGRVCKNDEGGQLVLKDKWTTFLKARLNCSLPGDYPFYFDEIQGMTYSEEEGVVYAVFTTPGNSIPGSAICSFNMSAIESAFSGAFKHQKNPGAAWERHQVPHGSHFECKGESNPQQVLDSSKYQLMDSAVQGVTNKPLYLANLETLTHIAVDIISTKLHKAVHILYVATIDGHIKKISVLPRTQQTCVIEVWNLSPPSIVLQIHSLRFFQSSMYVGTNTGVMRIRAQHCGRHKTRASCHNSMDPYCGWNELKLQCSTAPDENPLSLYWHQSVTECPLMNVRVDGGWGSWSDWFVCSQQTDSTVKEDSADKCKCRIRQCNNPEPQNGGAQCSGVSVSVTNCTVHGAWTTWSAWSQCSQSCGVAVKTRHRTCGNPAPAHGGRLCVGSERSEMYCTMNPPCPSKTIPPTDGQWGAWSEWEECSAQCGGGFRSRKRKCDNPAPMNGGQECPGSPVEYEKCNTYPCPEVKKPSAWTPWMIMSGSGVGNGYTEKRFKFSCTARTSDPNSIRIVQAKEEERYCQNNTSCIKNGRGYNDPDKEWSDWGEWSPCSKECGGGYKERSRICNGRGEDCEGSSTMTAPCNTHKCKGEWSCWTDWSSCSVSCGNGVMTRTRQCLNVDTKDIAGSYCDGSPISQKPCEMPSCYSLHGWDQWSAWSPCDENNEQHRRRKCLTNNPGPLLCQDRNIEARVCLPENNGLDNSISALGAQRNEEIKTAGGDVGVIFGACLAAFLFGSITSLLVFHYYQKKKKVKIPGSPHYISSKQNPYVTVPLREPPKRTPSSASNCSANFKTPNGVQPPKIFQKPAEYETATIKRNSHSLSNGHARNIEEDKFF